ncbi:MAG: hypothetical protein NVS9B10_05420 [Nevskia sp.]
MVGRLKVVEGKLAQLHRGLDGLFRAVPGQTLPPAAGDVIVGGALESSNVNLAGARLNMIQFAPQTKLVHAAEANAGAATGLGRMA